MLIWIIKTTGPVPWLSEESDQRLFRAGQFEAAIRSAGHRTLWFSSTFEHRSKTRRNVQANTILRPSPLGPEMIFLKSPSYHKNIGFGRFFNHWKQSRVWSSLAPDLPRPDLIFCSYPTIELSAAVVDFCQVYDVPVVLDIRDLWPDVIYERLSRVPFVGRVLQRHWLLPYERMSSTALRKATALTGVGRGMVKWAQERSGRPAELCAHDKHFYQSQPDPISIAACNAKLHDFWRAHGVVLEAPQFRIVWAGGLYTSIDAQTLFDGLCLLPNDLLGRIEVLVCGSGPLLELFQDAARKLPCLKLVDWVPHAKLMGVLRHSDAGLMNYFDRFDFRRSIPNKVVDYAAAGLPIITGVTGELTTLAGDSGAVIPYSVGDPVSICGAIEKVCELADRRAWRASPSRQLFETHFESATVMDEFVSFLEKTSRR
jgi:glycosyltransferase involved in cell wall biosynthesis